MKYKYWMFFTNTDMIGNKKEKYELYAYTDNKSLAEEFISTRNMKVFVYDKKDLTKEEVNALADLRYKYKYLSKVKLTTRSDKNKNKTKDIPIVMTESEKSFIIGKSAAVMNDMYVSSWYDPYIFNTELRKALFNIGYFKLNDDLNKEEYEIYDSNYKRILDKSPTIKIDELQLFIEQYRVYLEG